MLFLEEKTSSSFVLTDLIIVLVAITVSYWEMCRSCVALRFDFSTGFFHHTHHIDLKLIVYFLKYVYLHVGNCIKLSLFTLFSMQNLAHEGCHGTQPDVFQKAYYILLKGQCVQQKGASKLALRNLICRARVPAQGNARLLCLRLNPQPTLRKGGEGRGLLGFYV